MAVFEIARTVATPQDIVWAVISDMERYAEAAPNLNAVKVLEGAGTDMVRRCWDTHGGTWIEHCTWREEGKR